ncbi:MAG: GNAT family N-acetyltransferase [Betaproteobacteria bacterium]
MAAGIGWRIGFYPLNRRFLRGSVRAAKPADVAQLSSLFDQYRQFYDRPADLNLARLFIEQRVQSGDSTLLVAESDRQELVGFTQLYPTLCSVSAGPILVLYDLFVAAAHRRLGIGRALLQAARAHGGSVGALRIDLATATNNRAAQQLYEALGWVCDDAFHHYSLNLP